MVFDSFKTEIVTEKLVCNNQKGNEKLSTLNTYENLLIYPTGKDMGKKGHRHKKPCLITQKLL